MIKNKREVKAFLIAHPYPTVEVANTIKEGFVSCIKPVPTLFGAMLMCSKATYQDLWELMHD